MMLLAQAQMACGMYGHSYYKYSEDLPTYILSLQCSHGLISSMFS